MQKQDDEGWPKYLGTLQCEVALIGHKPLPPGSNIKFRTSLEIRSEPHLLVVHPATLEV